MKKLDTLWYFFFFVILVISLFQWTMNCFGEDVIVDSTPIKKNITITTTEAVTTTSAKPIKVKKVKVKYKKTMVTGEKQKIKVKKITPKKATNKKIVMINKSKKILSLKHNRVTAKRTGTGKILIKSQDGNYERLIKIKIVKPTPTCQGVKLKYSGRYNITSKPLTPSMGVKYYNGQRETYYSQRVLAGGGLKIPGRHIADDGTIRDKDGYIVVSTNHSFRSYHATFMTSLGPAKVYDTGCAYGTVDIYVNW